MFIKSGLVLAAAATIVSASPMPAHVPAGKKRDFVYTNGQKFGLNGLDFYFAGSNAYYMPFSNTYDDNIKGLTAARKAGLKVMRTWAADEVNKTFIDWSTGSGSLPQYYQDASGVYFQQWDNGKATINYGANGLQKLDDVVKAALATDVKLIMSLTNNWADYGGMDMYTVNLGYKYHDDFYTQKPIIDAFKNYVSVIVNRYKDSPAVMAWEVGNEPRCGADGTRNLPRSPSGCNTTVLTNWISEISSFIKSIDADHLVTTGSEGFFNTNPTGDDWAYNGADGVDYYTETGLSTIDFGCFHLYPDWWSKTTDWANQFIIDHATAAKAQNKPTVFEEYGWLLEADREAWLGRTSNETRLAVISRWQQTSIEQKIAGDMYWQFGYYGYSYGPNNNDGFTIYLNDTEAGKLVYEHARHVSDLNHK